MNTTYSRVWNSSLKQVVMASGPVRTAIPGPDGRGKFSCDRYQGIDLGAISIKQPLGIGIRLMGAITLSLLGLVATSFPASAQSVPPDYETSVAIGGFSRAESQGGVAVGAFASSEGRYSIAIGTGTAAANFSVAVGLNSLASGENDVAIGAGSVTGKVSTGTTALFGGTMQGTAKQSSGVVSIGASGAERQLQNLAAGVISTTSTDAVNGSQLQSVATGVNVLGDSTASILGGGATYQQATGTISGFTVPVNTVDAGGKVSAKATPQMTVAGSFDALNTSVNHLAGNVTKYNSSVDALNANVNQLSDSAVKYDKKSNGSINPTSVSVGTSAAPAQIHHVASATAPDDAPNWAQVQGAIGTLSGQTNDRFDSIQRRVASNRQQSNRGIAAAAALMNNMPYVLGRTAVNAGLASYRGESALGVGISRWNGSGRVNLNAGVSAAKGDAPIFRFGVGLLLGD